MLPGRSQLAQGAHKASGSDNRGVMLEEGQIEYLHLFMNQAVQRVEGSKIILGH